MNKICLVGNLTADPEVRQSSGGVSVCTFSIAVSRHFTNQNGERETDFIPVVTWRALADNCGKYLAKGRKVAVAGALQTRRYEDKQGNKRTAFEVVADDVEFLTPKGEGGSAPKASAQENAADLSGFEAFDESRLPF